MTPLFSLILLTVLQAAARITPSSGRVKQGSVDDPLPPGWRAAVDPRSKRTYYWNQQTLETRWRRPVATDTAVEAPKAASVEKQVPAAVSKVEATKLPTHSSVTPMQQLTEVYKSCKRSVARVWLVGQKTHADGSHKTVPAPVLGVYLASLFLAAASFL